MKAAGTEGLQHEIKMDRAKCDVSKPRGHERAFFFTYIRIYLIISLPCRHRGARAFRHGATNYAKQHTG